MKKDLTRKIIMLLISICDKPNSTWKAPYSGYKQGSKSTQSAKICPKSVFSGGGGGLVFQTNSTQSAKICPNLHWGGGGSRLTLIFMKYLSGGTQGILNQNFQPLELATA